jgi:hypothetical protein
MLKTLHLHLQVCCKWWEEKPQTSALCLAGLVLEFFVISRPSGIKSKQNHISKPKSNIRIESQHLRCSIISSEYLLCTENRRWLYASTFSIHLLCLHPLMPPQQPRFSPRSGFMVAKLTQGQIFSEYFNLSCHFSFSCRTSAGCKWAKIRFESLWHVIHTNMKYMITPHASAVFFVTLIFFLFY